MSFLGGAYVPGNPFEGVIKHGVKRGVEAVMDAFESRSQASKQFKIDKKRLRDEYFREEMERHYKRDATQPPTKKLKMARRAPRSSRRSYRRPRRSTRRYRRNPRPARYLWEPFKLVKFSVVDPHTFNGTTGAIGTGIYKANSLNDPLGTTGANLPIGLDQWAALYSKYKVVSSMIRVTGHPTTVTGTGILGVHLTDDSSGLTEFEHYMELPHTKTRFLSADLDIGSVTKGYSAKKFWSFNSIKNEDEQEGTFSTTPGDPDKIAYYHVFVQDGNKTETVTIDLVVQMTFTVLLYDRIMPARSSL